jgi:dTMP kinase
MKKQDKGLFLVIEGTDGSGKTTQYNMLKERLQESGYDVLEIHFPRYEEPSSFFVREYLSGKYGSADEVGPYVGSLFYALDRYQAAPIITQALEQGKVVLCDRYIGSNMAHQGTKFSDAEQRRGYFLWLDSLEHQMLGIPRPDIALVLMAPYDVIQKRLAEKEHSSAHVIGKDVHEANPEHLKKSIEVYRDICNLFPKDFKRVDAVRNNKVLDINTVGGLIWETIKPLLPAKPKRKTGKAEVQEVKPANPYISKKDDGTYEITPAGTEFLRQTVTDEKDNVYAFNENMSPITIAAAMARLSRRGDDMRVTLLDEFAHAAGKDDKLLRRVITAYGDDSVQQLVGQHVVVEGASNLLTKKLEWGRLAAYLEQSTRYIYFDQKDENGNYKYYTPSHFDTETYEIYQEAMDQIFDLYSMMVRKLTDYVRSNSDVPKAEQDIAWQGATRAQACDAVRAVLPVATKATVGIYASGQALESLIMHLLSDELPEAVETGQKLLDHARRVIPTFLERADKPDRGGAAIAYRANTAQAVRELANQYLPPNHSTETESVRLTGVWPRNELDLIPDMLYEHSSLPLQSIKEEVNGWDYDKKQKVFQAYMGERLNRRHKPGRALENAHYSWDLVCDYGIFRDLQRHRMVDDLEWQQLTPRYGYEVPQIVEDAGLDEVFQTCFDLSLKLYSALQAAGYALEAQYATLLGHKMRWKVTYNAREAFHLHELRTSPQGHPGYRKLVLEMHEKLSEVHPMLGAAMKFVNTGEDPALSRLAAERYTQFKLEQMKD